MSIRRSSGQGLATVALDASVLINILILNRVAILAELPGYRFVVLDAVSILSRGSEDRGDQPRRTARREGEAGTQPVTDAPGYIR